MPFPHYKQLDAMDCGPTCLRMVAKYYGKSVSLDYLRNKAQFGKEGVSLLGLAEAAESIGFKSVGAKLSFEQLINDVPLPAILHWDQTHFVVLTPGSTAKKLVIADPARSVLMLAKPDFLSHWISTQEDGLDKGIVLLLEPTPQFNQSSGVGEDEKQNQGKLGWGYFISYLSQYRRYFLQMILGLMLGSTLQIIFPYLTQSIVDKGINTRDFTFIQIVLLAQFMLLFSQTAVEFIRSRILLFISTRINLSILSAFWAKLLRLPLWFFDTKHPGDIIQRIGDHLWPGGHRTAGTPKAASLSFRAIWGIARAY